MEEMRMAISTGWRLFAEVAEALIADPTSAELATAVLTELEACYTRLCNEDDLEILTKVGYMLALNFGGAFPPFRWPVFITGVLMACVENDGAALMDSIQNNLEIQRLLERVAAEVGCEPYQLAPIFGSAVDAPRLVTDLDYRLWHWAIMDSRNAKAWREVAGLGYAVTMVHPFSGLVQTMRTVAVAINSGP